MSNSVVLERLPTAAGIRLQTRYEQARRQRVYIFLTRHGLVFGINILVMLIGAVNYNNSLAYSLTFLLGGLFMVAMLHTYSNLRGLIISSTAAEPVFAGQQAAFPLIFDNRFGKTRIAISIGTRLIIKKLLRKKTTWQNRIAIDMLAATLQSHHLVIDAPTRGYLNPGRIRISSTWPLGLFRAWSYMQVMQGSIVYPTPAGSSTLALRAGLDEEEQAGKGSGSEDFVGFRQYRSGDSMRAVDWKAYARERGLISKRFTGRGTKKILIDWQHTEHLGDIEKRLSQLCLWILEAEKLQARYALSLPGHTQLEFSNGDNHKHQCLRALAVYGIDDEQP